MNKEFLSAEKATESKKELPPEAIEKIMTKVIDIDTPGNGYHAINASRLERRDKDEIVFENVLRNGLMHLKTNERFFEGLSDDPSEYFRMNREEYSRGLINLKNTDRDDKLRILYGNESLDSLFFNIVGKGEEEPKYSGETQISNDPFFRYRNSGGLVFDLKGFKDYAELSDEEAKKTDAAKSEVNQVYNRSKLSDPYLVVGYNGEIRISPARFKGIVFRLVNPDNDELDETDPEKYRIKAQKIAEIMQRANGKNQNRLIPIYDVHGNLWWPKQMNYDQIKSGGGKKTKT